MNLVLLCGGLGGARLAPALGRALGRGRLTVVANVGDDLHWMGLRVCPDVDSVLYALAGVWDGARGWGRRDETFRVRDELVRRGRPGWFRVGDRDLALHLERTRLLSAGKTLTEVTREIAAGLGVHGISVVPASDEFAPTRVVTRSGRTLEFQEWYVRDQARPRLSRTLLSRHVASRAALRALAQADSVILGPSNPVTSIGAILALRGMTAAVRGVPRRIAVSPVVSRRRTRSPTIERHARARRRVLEPQGLRDRAASIAARYVGLVDDFVIDRADAGEAPALRRLGLEPVITEVLAEGALARAILEIASR